MKHLTHVSLGWIALTALACGGGSQYTPPAAPVYSLTEERAVDVITRVLDEQRVRVVGDWRVVLAGDDGMPLAVDLRVAESPFGIEWVSPEDRANHHGLPAPDPQGSLRLVSGWDAPAGHAPGDTAPRTSPQAAQVLLLDHASYRYGGDLLPGTARPSGAAMDLAEAEARLERDVRDFLEYVQGQQDVR